MRTAKTLVSWADAQADQSLCWAHRSFCWFCHVVVQFNRQTHENIVRFGNLFASSSMLGKLKPCTFELPHDKTNKMACAPGKDSDQPGHLPSLIRVFTVHMKKPWVLSYPLSAQRRLIRLADAQADLSLCMGQSFCWFCHEAAHFYKSQMAAIAQKLEL